MRLLLRMSLILGGFMKEMYCGACSGERGCAECGKTGCKKVYASLVDFSVKDMVRKESGEPKNNMGSGRGFLRELFLAADIGTTTLAFVCTNEQGQILASYGTENPQRKVSADVIGRMDAAIHGARETLKNEIREALVKGFLFVLKEGFGREGEELKTVQMPRIRIAIGGNTVMQHLLLGYPLEGMAKAPFRPYSLQQEERLFSELFSETGDFSRCPPELTSANVTVMPCFSAFLGGDAMAGAYGFLNSGTTNVPQADIMFYPESGVDNRVHTAVRLLLDLGTNAELLLKVNGKMYGTAAAMGSAFEGGRFAYASELFSLIAKARKQGALDETGLLAEPYFSEGYWGLRQEDVRFFQLAKGALRAGIELLTKRAGLTFSEIEQIYLAGGVGAFCEEGDLFTIGLLPEEFLGKVQFVGNSCIGGLIAFLQDGGSMEHRDCDVMNLAEEPEFEKEYYRYMDFR